MKPHDDLHEQDLIQHYRQHGPGEPDAALDARILAAAHQAVKHPGQGGASVRSLWQRLFAPSGLAALAGVACLGLALSLSWRSGLLDGGDPDARYGVPATLEKPQAMAPAASPVAPMTQQLEPAPDLAKRKAEVAVSAEKMAARRSQPPAAPQLEAQPAAMAESMAESLADQAPAEDSLAPGGAVAGLASDADPAQADEPRASLLRLRELRAQGRVEEARVLEAELRRRYPQLDLEDELKRLAP